MQVLDRDSTIKKLRTASKEQDQTINNLKEKLTQAELLLEKRNERVKALEVSEKKYSETLTTMKEISDVAAKKFEKKEQESSAMQKQVQELQVIRM